ncbi:MAG: ribose 5-phosphate isomerase B [Ignavibacteriae bacterium]|nr:ribose 5-phosphate isomerase B [Ignavibacteriota bacterium]
MKEQLKSFLLDAGYTVADVGTNSEQACDYPDFAFAVATLVSSGQAAKGIMVDGVGVASAMVANKVPGVRAANCTSEFAARSSREHNDANVLTLGGRVLGIESAKAITKVWLETWFGGGRHQARVQKISDIEKRYSKNN